VRAGTMLTLSSTIRRDLAKLCDIVKIKAIRDKAISIEAYAK
jgi:hypothetical protein